MMISCLWLHYSTHVYAWQLGITFSRTMCELVCFLLCFAYFFD